MACVHSLVLSTFWWNRRPRRPSHLCVADATKLDRLGARTCGQSPIQAPAGRWFSPNVYKVVSDHDSAVCGLPSSTYRALFIPTSAKWILCIQSIGRVWIRRNLSRGSRNRAFVFRGLSLTFLDVSRHCRGALRSCFGFIVCPIWEPSRWNGPTQF